MHRLLAMSFRASDRCHWRGNPSSAPAGAETPPPSAREVSWPSAVTEGERKTETGGAEPRPYAPPTERASPEGVSKEGGPRPSPFGRFKEGGFSRGKGNRNPFPLEWRFWLLLSLLTKVTRRRQKRAESQRAGQSPAPTHLLMYRVSVPCLSLWERWPSAARTERANNDHLVLLFKKAARPSQSPAVTALPKGEPRICAPLYRRIPRRREAVRPCNRLPTEWPSYFPKMQIIFYCGEKKPLIS